MRIRFYTAAMVVIVLIAGSPSPASAQESIGQELRPTLTFEVGNTKFKSSEDLEINAMTGTAVVSLALPLSRSTTFHLSIPMSRASVTISDAWFGGTYTSSGVGNPYVGMSVIERYGSTILSSELGIRLPLSTGELADSYGAFESIIDAPETFVWKTSAARFRLAAQRHIGRGFVRITGGPTVLRANNDGRRDEPQYVLNLHYGLGVGIDRGIRLEAGARGIMPDALSTRLELRDTMHEAYTRLSYPAGRVTPMFEARLPLDDELRDIVAASFRAGIAVAF